MHDDDDFTQGPATDAGAADPRIRVRAQLPGWAASRWANVFAATIIGAVVFVALLGWASQSAESGGSLTPVAGALLAADAAALVVSGVALFRRVTAERALGYTTIDGLRVGAASSLMPGTPDSVDTVDAHTGVVLRASGDVLASEELIAARLRAADARRAAGERAPLL